MNSTNSHDTQRYATYKAASLCRNDGDTLSSYIPGYEPDHRPTARARAEAEAVYESRKPLETSHIRTVTSGCMLRVGIPSTLMTAIGGMASPGFLAELLASPPGHVFEPVPTVLGPEVDAVLLLKALTEEWIGRIGPSILGYPLTVPNHDPLLARAVERLESFRTLGPNWNGYDGVPPTGQAIDECLAFAMSLPALARAPVAMASGQGEVGLLWERDGDDALVEIGFRGDGSYGFLAVMPDGASIEAEGVLVGEDVPSALTAALSVFIER